MRKGKIFYEDAYLTEFDACVMSCEPASDGYLVVLDRTAFYPEGGGQPCDIGSLDEAQVTDVHYRDEEICHMTDRALTPGTIVHGSVDFAHRFDLMQQHSGEHIISGMINRQYGYDNVGFHMGKDVVTIDLNGLLTMEQLLAIEEEVNTYIWQNHDAVVRFLSDEEKEEEHYRSKKELSGEVRLVAFPGGDACACCGLHVRNTGEIGLVRFLSCKRFREGVRIELLCGKRAYRYLRSQDEENRKIGVALSAKPEETSDAVNRLLKENYALKGQILKAREEACRRRAESVRNQEDIFLFEEGLTPAEVRNYADSLLDSCKGTCAVFSGDDISGYRYAIGRRGGDLRDFVKDMNGALDGRGGGKPAFAQGAVMKSMKEIQEFFEEKGFHLI